MSSVLLGLEKPSFAWRALGLWADSSLPPSERTRSVLGWSLQGGPATPLIAATTGIYSEDPARRESALRFAHDRLGSSGMRRETATYALREWVAAPLPAYALDEATFVNLVLASACAAEHLAHRVECDPAQAFLATLFAWMGIAPVGRLLARVRPSARYSGPLQDVAQRLRWEREQTHTDSLGVASKLLQLWDYPESLVAAIRGVAYPLLVLQGRPLAMLAYTGILMGPAILTGASEPELDRTGKKCVEALGLSTGFLAETVETTAREVLALVSEVEAQSAASF